MNWLRLYHEARTDKKLNSLTDAQFRVWFNLLCFSGEQPERGRIQFDDLDLLAVEVANGDADLLSETIGRLVKLKILETSEGEAAFVNFEKRQYDKPSDTPERVAERVRQHRERQRNAAQTPCNADVTPSNALDTERDTETERVKALSCESDAPAREKPPKPAKAKAGRRSKLPEDWQPTDRQRESLGEQGFSGAEIDAELFKFQNYHLHKGDVGLDWGRAFANWMARSRDLGPPKRAANVHAPPGKRFATELSLDDLMQRAGGSR